MKTVLVIGDTLLDEYVSGEVSRISPEGPFPILDITEEKKMLGGAANVAANIRSLRPTKDLVIHYEGFWSQETLPLFHKYRLQLLGPELPDEEILKKKRYCSGRYQLLRVDHKKKYNKEVLVPGINYNQYDLIVISNYNKGSIGNMYCLIKDEIKADIPMLIEDKRGRVYDFYDKNVIFKANHKEVKTDKSTACNAKEVVITKGAEGFELLVHGGVFPATQKQGDVVDVCGAGDSFLAGMAVNFLETGNFDPLEMTLFGNFVAGEKVKRFGTVAVKREWMNNDDE